MLRRIFVFGLFVLFIVQIPGLAVAKGGPKDAEGEIKKIRAQIAKVKQQIVKNNQKTKIPSAK